MVGCGIGFSIPNKKKREFYSFYSGKHFALEAPESYGRTCFGTSSGWLLTYGLDQQLHLLNPLTWRQLLLPAATTFADQYTQYDSATYTPELLRNINLRRVLILTCTPDRVPLVVVIYGNWNRLAMAKPGDDSWSPVEPSSLYGFREIAFFNGQLLALILDKIYVCDLLSSVSPRLEAFHIQPSPNKCPKTYLVDLGGELYLLDGHVRQRNDRLCFVRHFFMVHRLSIAKKTWEEVPDIGDWTVFLGRNSTFALLSSDHPQCVANSIYFTDEDFIYYKKCGGCSMGIYSFEKNNVVWYNEEEELAARTHNIVANEQTSDDDDDDDDDEDEEEEVAGAHDVVANEQTSDDDEELKAIITPFPVSHDLAYPNCPPLLLAPSLLW